MKKIGRFRIPRHSIDNEPDLVKQVLHDVLVVQASARYFPDAIEYVALSERFDAVEEGFGIPCYTASFEKNPDATVVFTGWQKL